MVITIVPSVVLVPSQPPEGPVGSRSQVLLTEAPYEVARGYAERLMTWVVFAIVSSSMPFRKLAVEKVPQTTAKARYQTSKQRNLVCCHI